MNLDLLQQIYPYVNHAKKMIPSLKSSDKDALMADLYLAMSTYYNSEIPKFLGRLERLEALKKGKREEYLDNIKRQQDSVLKESKEAQNDLLGAVYNKWIENLSEEYFN